MCNLLLTATWRCWDCQPPARGNNTEYLLLWTEISHVSIIVTIGMEHGKQDKEEDYPPGAKATSLAVAEIGGTRQTVMLS